MTAEKLERLKDALYRSYELADLQRNEAQREMDFDRANFHRGRSDVFWEIHRWLVRDEIPNVQSRADAIESLERLRKQT